MKISELVVNDNYTYVVGVGGVVTIDVSFEDWMTDITFEDGHHTITVGHPFTYTWSEEEKK